MGEDRPFSAAATSTSHRLGIRRLAYVLNLPAREVKTDVLWMTFPNRPNLPFSAIVLLYATCRSDVGKRPHLAPFSTV